MKTKYRLAWKPDSQAELRQLARKTLEVADSVGIIPTPIDDLLRAARITSVADIPQVRAGFLRSLKGRAKRVGYEALQKLRGIADLRERAVWIPDTGNPRRDLFPKGHELGHQVIPWHNIDPTYLDDEETLSPRIDDKLEREANFFSSEVIFQGELFGPRVRSYEASLEAAFSLADEHQASYQSTIWRYVEEQDEAVAVAHYYPGKIYDDQGHPVLKLWKTVPSRRFQEKFSEVELPSRLRSSNPWMQALEIQGVCSGTDRFLCDGRAYKFLWEAWWNQYTLFVFLRRRPVFGMVGAIIK